MTIDARFNISPFIGDIIIAIDDASTCLTCMENLDHPGQYIKEYFK